MLEALTRATADLGVDLGTSFTRVVARGADLIEQPTVVAIQRGLRGKEQVVVGTEARKMLGRAPEGTEVIRPVRGGVVADFISTERLLRSLLGGRLRKPRLLVAIPSGSSEVERRAVQECARAAGAREVQLVPTSMAAAIGAGLPVTEPIGSLLVDIGAGRTEVVITSLGGIVVSRSIRVAGDAMDEAIADWLAREHGLAIGDRTIRTLKHRVGCATPPPRPRRMRVRGRDLAGGPPREIELLSPDLAAALAGPTQRIREVVVEALSHAPPELSADIIDRGMILCGGGSCLWGLDAQLRDATALPVLEAEDRQHCVARGLLRILDDHELFRRVSLSA